MFASACCWLPLLLLAVGVSGAAVGAAFEQYRPIFLSLSFALLGAAFYFAYRPGPQMTANAVAGEQSVSCCGTEREIRGAITKTRTLQRFNRSMLWVVTIIVLTFAFFPNYVGIVSSNTAQRHTVTTRDGFDTVAIAIEGMTCKACAKTLQTELATVPGVSTAEVSYEKGLALVDVAKGHAAPVANLLVKIKDAGFGGRLVDLHQ
jgi:copper chaperone CopZ